MTALHDLYERGGQSPWIDDLRRSYVTTGGLNELVAQGVRGLTSNPTIMAKSIEATDEYDAQFTDLLTDGKTVEEAYWELVLFDARAALGILRPIYDASHGGDGFVSVEVAPGLAHDTAGTITSARVLAQRVNLPNLLVKIPATLEGLPAIEQMIAEGHSINVTLIFSLARYEAVIEAYLRGLERFAQTGGDLSSVASVASFFVSRVDTEVDRRLEELAAATPDSPLSKKALTLRGKAAIAQARLAYALFAERFSGPRWEALAVQGAKVQRPLWASTSTKNPAYPDLLYVEQLVGPDTVDTMPAATVSAFLDHGHVSRTIDRLEGDESSPEDPEANPASVAMLSARADLDGLSEVGVDLDEVTAVLESEGVASFGKSFDELLERLAEKASSR